MNSNLRTLRSSPLNDDGKLAAKFLNKQVNAAKEGIDFLMSAQDIQILMQRAGIRSSDWGFRSGRKFVLSRQQDLGPYQLDNCSFILQSENAKHKKISKASRLASQKNARKGLAAMNQPKAIAKRQKALRTYQQRRKTKAAENNKARIARLHPSYAGSHNSQFGSFWLTDGTNNIKWSNEKGDWPKKFRKGRAM